eukprot:4552302-Heterocapsa_arctica.AAC.1
MGHIVQTIGDYEYCLGCGRDTRSQEKRVFWRRNHCKPVIRLVRYKKKHDIIFELPIGATEGSPWWPCRGCKARGPELNKRDCTNPIKDQEDNNNQDNDDYKVKRRRITDYSQAIDNEEERMQGYIANKGARHRAK